MKIALRVLAGDRYGWGNFDRLYTLGKELKKRNNEIFFFVENSIEAYNISKKIFKNSFFIRLRLSEKEEIKIFNNNFFDIFIYEGEYLSIKKQKLYKLVSKQFVIFDDLFSKKNYLADKLFICQENYNYKKRKLNNVKIYYGYEYFPYFQKKINFITHRSNNIIITLGGGNYYNLYIKLLKLLINSEFKVFIFINNKDTIKKIKKSSVFKINNFNFLFEKEDIMNSIPVNNIRFAIVNGGYNKLIFNFHSIPVLIIATRYHQINITKCFCLVTKSVYLGYIKILKKNYLKKVLSRNLYYTVPKQNKIKFKNNLLIKSLLS